MLWHSGPSESAEFALDSMESAHRVHHAPASRRRLADFRVDCWSAAHITERQFTAKAAKRPKPPLFTRSILGSGPHATPMDYLVPI